MDIKQIEQTLYIATRFKPEYYGIVVSHDGWMNVSTVIQRINFVHGYNMIDRSIFNKIVKNNPKFEVNTFKTKVKANKVGNAEEVQSQKIKKTIPPDFLYYTTTSILNPKVGIRPIEGEQYVVLKTEYPQNANAGSIYKIDSQKMFAAGHVFFITDNGDILTATVGPKFIIGLTKGDR
jgi:putative RNA 2'-phosphotransferase